MNDEQRTDDAGNSPSSGGESSSPESAWRRFAPVLKSWAIFLGVLGSLVAINQWKSDWVNVHFAEWTASVMAGIMDALGERGTSFGIHVGCRVCKFRIIGECTAYYPIAIYIAAVAAFPSPWLRRLLGILIGVPIVVAINQVRLVSLCYISRAFPDQFDTIHIVVWQSLIIFFTVLTWILWVSTLGRRS